MGGLTTRLVKYWQIGYDIREYAIKDLLGELTMILITIWSLQKLGNDLTVSKQEAQEFEGKIYPQEAKWADG